jgi:mycothiol synthase
MKIAPFDFLAEDETTSRRVFELMAGVERELAPEDPVPVWEQLIERQQRRASWYHRHYFAAWDGDQPVGLASAEWETGESNLELGGFDVTVTPEARRNGIGRRLAASAISLLAENGRTSVYAGTWEGSPGEGFLSALGMAPKLRERKSRCYVKDIDIAMLEAWVDGAVAREEGYSLLTWDGAAPDEYVERFAEIIHIMNTAPREGFEMEDDVTTVEMIREHDVIAEAAGLRRYVSVVRHDESGAFAGFTTLAVEKWHPEKSEQWGTCTDPAHRNKGIGRWLKGANALRLLSQHPEIEFIDTWNAGSNRPMLSINEAMGFRPLRYWNNYQAPRSVIEERLG